MPNHSTTTCLLQIQNTITKLLDEPKFSAVTFVSFDLRRAFDTVPHMHLLQKLSYILPLNIWVNLVFNFI